MISNLWLLFLAIAKTAVYCGFAPGAVLIYLYVQVSGRAVSRQFECAVLSGNKPAPEVIVLRRAA